MVLMAMAEAGFPDAPVHLGEPDDADCQATTLECIYITTETFAPRWRIGEPEMRAFHRADTLVSDHLGLPRIPMCENCWATQSVLDFTGPHCTHLGAA